MNEEKMNKIVQERAKELFKKAQDCQWCDAEYGMDDVTAKNIALMVCDELISVANIGYDYDAEFEIPFYEKVKTEIKKLGD